MAAETPIRVMLVDDHPLLRRGLQDTLDEADAFEVIALAADGLEAVRLARETQPDVVVMDVMMPVKDGVEACREILEQLPGTKILMFTASTEDDAVVESLAAGAAGFVQKFSSSDELLDAILTVASGKYLVPNDALRRVFTLIRSGAVAAPGPKLLTAREREILAQFARGNAYGRIAEELGLSTVTVRNAIYRVQDKLGVDSKQEIVVWAVRNGLIDDHRVGGS